MHHHIYFNMISSRIHMHQFEALLRPYMQGFEKKASKALRAKLASNQKKSKKPLVKKGINKRTGKTQVSLSYS